MFAGFLNRTVVVFLIFLIVFKAVGISVTAH
jgi:hypothetical protein